MIFYFAENVKNLQQPQCSAPYWMEKYISEKFCGEEMGNA